MSYLVAVDIVKVYERIDAVSYHPYSSKRSKEYPVTLLVIMKYHSKINYKNNDQEYLSC